MTISGLRGRLAAESPILGVQNCGASTRKKTASSTLCLLHNFERPKLDNYFSAARRPEMTPLDLTFDCSKLKSFKKIAVALWRSVRSDSPPGWHSSCKPALRLTKSRNSNGIFIPLKNRRALYVLRSRDQFRQPNIQRRLARGGLQVKAKAKSALSQSGSR